jgi:hypothetical protein
MGPGTDESGEAAGGGGGGKPPSPPLPATGGHDVAFETERSGVVSWGLVGSYSFTMAFLLSGLIRRQCQQRM